MRIPAFLLFVLFAKTLQSQNNASLSSSNGKTFKVILKGQPLNKIYEAHVVIEKILKDTLQLELEFENKKKIPATIYLLEKGIPCKNKEFNYLVDFDNTSLDLRFIGVYNLKPMPDPLVPKAPVIDTSLKYRNKVLSHFCELKDNKATYYNNLPHEGNCVTAMPQEYMNYTAILMSRASLPAQKYQIVENVLRNNCISVEQLNTLLGYVEYEIDKLKLIRIGYFHLTDAANQKNLEKNFRFEASVNELNTFFKTSNDYKMAAASNCTVAASQMLVDSYTARLGSCSNDSERFDVFKKGYSELCYSIQQVTEILNKFIHDREKLDAAQLLYFNCVEKEKYTTLSFVFSYNQTMAELKDFIEKQKH